MITDLATLFSKHGWAAANQTLSMLRSIYRRPCVDHEGLRNPVELWLREPAQGIVDRIDELSFPPPMDTAVSS